MTVATTWLIEQMECYPQHQGQTNVVFNVHWRVNAVDGAYSATNYGTCNVPYDAESPFTPFDQLTKAQVVGWIQTAMGQEQVAAIEFKLATDIVNQMDPPVVTPSLPWDVK
jgi:hypothetical protein